MNERIRELQIQAEAAADEIFDRKGKMYGEIVLEKFAELIIRECAEYAEHNLDMAGYKKKFMLKHFGVEE